MYDKFVVLQSQYIYPLYTTICCNKYNINVPGNGTQRNVVEYTAETFAVCFQMWVFKNGVQLHLELLNQLFQFLK